jgi:hypothetical protein
VTFSVRDTFFPSFDTEIFLKSKNQQTQAGQNRRAKKNERNAASSASVLFSSVLRLLHFSFLLPPLVVCLLEEENFVVVVVAPPTPSPHLLPLHFRRRRPFRRRPRAFDKKSITVVEIVFESFHKPPPKQ